MEFVLALVAAIVGGALSLPALHKDGPIQHQGPTGDVLDKSSNPTTAIQKQEEQQHHQQEGQKSINAKDALVHSIDLLDITIDALSNLKSSNEPKVQTEDDKGALSNRKSSKDQEETEIERKDGKSDTMDLLDELDSRLGTKVSEKVRRSVLDDVKQLLESKFSSLLEDELQWRSAKKGILKRRPKPKIITKTPILLEKKKIKKEKTSQEDESNYIKILTDGSLQDSSDVTLRNIVDQLLKEDEDKSTGSNNLDNNQNNSIEYNDIISELIQTDDQGSNSNTKTVTSDIGTDTEELLNNFDLDEILGPVLKELSDSVNRESVIGNDSTGNKLKAGQKTHMDEKHVKKTENGSKSQDQYESQSKKFSDVNGKEVNEIDTDEHDLHAESDDRAKLRNHQNNNRRSQQYPHNNQDISEYEYSQINDTSNNHNSLTKHPPTISTNDLTDLNQPKSKVEHYDKHNDSKIIKIKVHSNEQTSQETNKQNDPTYKETKIVSKITEKNPKNVNNHSSNGQKSNTSMDDEIYLDVSTDKNTNSVSKKTMVTEEDDYLAVETRRANDEESNARDIDDTEEDVNSSDGKTISHDSENTTKGNGDNTDDTNTYSNEVENVTAHEVYAEEKYSKDKTNSSNADMSENETVNYEENTKRKENNNTTDVGTTDDQLDTMVNETERDNKKQDNRQIDKLGNAGSNSLRELLDNEDIVQSYSFMITFTPK